MCIRWMSRAMFVLPFSFRFCDSALFLWYLALSLCWGEEEKEEERPFVYVRYCMAALGAEVRSPFCSCSCCFPGGAVRCVVGGVALFCRVPGWRGKKGLVQL